MNTGSKLAAILFLAASNLAVLPYASAQTFPSRPIRLIVAFPPGGAVDITARLVAKHAEPRFGQAVIIENRPGANALVGANAALQSAPDGYTLYIGSLASLSATVLPVSTIDPLRDFAPVANAVRGGYLLYVRADLPARSFDELVAQAKAAPGKLNFASSSPLTEAMYAVLKGTRGLDATSVSYKGSGPAVLALVAGESDFSIDSLPSYLNHVRSGKVRALFATLPTTLLPEVPTIEKAGVGNFNATWNIGIAAPAQTPAAVVAALNPPLRQAVADPTFAQQARALGGEPSSTSPEEFRGMVEAEVRFWSDAARLTGKK